MKAEKNVISNSTGQSSMTEYFNCCSSPAVAIHRHRSLTTRRSTAGDDYRRRHHAAQTGTYPSTFKILPAPTVTTRVAAVAPPKSHNLIHHRHQRNPTTRYMSAYLEVVHVVN